MSPRDIQQAFAVIQSAFRSDPEFRQGYIDNVANFLFHHCDMRDFAERNKAADHLVQLLFETNRS